MANLKYHNSKTGKWEEIKVSTKFTELWNTQKLTQDQNYVDIGITNFNPNEDVVFSVLNSTWLQRNEDYIVNSGLLRIESKDGTLWKKDDIFNFTVLKNVDKDALPSADGSLIQDGSITISKLATSLQTYINKIGLSVLNTTAVTLSDAINELNSQLSEIVQEIVTTPTANKLLKLNSSSKLPASITGDSDSVDGIQGNQITLKSTVAITYYVNATSGSDANDGITSGTAFKTIGKAISMIPQVINHDVTINVASGIYNENVLFAGIYGNGYIYLKGDTVVSNTRIVNSLKCYNCTSVIIITGFSTNTTTDFDMVVARCLSVEFHHINSTIANAHNGFQVDTSFAYISDSVISNKNYAISTYINGNVLSQNNSGSGNTIGLGAAYNGSIGKGGTQPSGTIAEQIGAGGVIR